MTFPGLGHACEFAKLALRKRSAFYPTLQTTQGFVQKAAGSSKRGGRVGRVSRCE